MDIRQLEKGNELLKIIESTKEGLKAIDSIENKIRDYKDKKHYDDGLYSLNIGIHSDFSGNCVAKLNRYTGNVDLLYIIKDTLEKQLEQYEAEFENL